jgi:hypothetical protein
MTDGLIEKKTEWTDEQIESLGDTIVLSTLSVMESAAGWYLGRLCKTVGGEHDGLIEPHDRLTGYMSYEQATKQLQTIRN